MDNDKYQSLNNLSFSYVQLLVLVLTPKFFKKPKSRSISETFSLNKMQFSIKQAFIIRKVQRMQPNSYYQAWV